MAASTEVELYEEQPPARILDEFRAYNSHARDIVDGWAPIFIKIDELANAIADVQVMPKGLQSNPAAILVNILAGRELGMGPIASIRHVQNVDGTLSVSSEWKRAKVLAEGHEYRIVDLTVLKCVIEGRRRGQSNWTRFEYTITDAKRSRLVKPRGAWETRPKRMLLARASSDMCDAIFPDCTNGMPTAELVAEEYEDGEFNEAGGSDMAVLGTAEKKPVRRRRSTRKAAAPEPELTKEPEQPEQPEPADDPELIDENWDDPAEEEWFDDEPGEVAAAEPMIEPGQVTRLQAQAKALRLDDEQRHRAASDITGREIGSFKELTEDEAGEVINIFSVAQRKENPQAALKRLVASAVREREDYDEED